jgi:hypothetical protein
MSFKTILVPIEQHDRMNATLETALLLARKFDSYVSRACAKAQREFVVAPAVDLEPTPTIGEKANRREAIFE